jgi:hypothetical protein
MHNISGVCRVYEGVCIIKTVKYITNFITI